MDWVTFAVYAGLVVVLIGPAIGTYMPIRNARTPAARRFLTLVAAAMWALILLLGLLPVLLAYHGVIPKAGWAGSFLLFLILPAIPWINRRVQELETPGTIPESPQSGPPPRGG